MASESPIIDTSKGTVSFARKVSVRPYESAEAAIYVQFDIPPQTDEAATKELIANARAAFFSAKALVFEELGIEFKVEEGGVIREVLKAEFGNVTEVVGTTPAGPAAPAGPPTEAQPPYPINDQGRAASGDKEEDKANKQWAKNRFYSNPDEFYDNRGRKASGEYKSTSPDVKHKTTKVGAWLS